MLKPYFRPEVRGLENIPDGPVLLVGNHSGGTLIADTFVFAYAFIKHFGSERLFHQLVHDVAVNMPMVARGLRKYGGMAASNENAERALERGAAVLVYPGGDCETYRPSWHQDRIEFGGRRGLPAPGAQDGRPDRPRRGDRRAGDGALPDPRRSASRRRRGGTG